MLLLSSHEHIIYIKLNFNFRNRFIETNSWYQYWLFWICQKCIQCITSTIILFSKYYTNYGLTQKAYFIGEMLLLSSHEHIIYIKLNFNFRNIVILSESEEKRRYLTKNWIRTGFISTIYVLIHKMYLIH
jgi:hypothetical protein